MQERHFVASRSRSHRATCWLVWWGGLGCTLLGSCTSLPDPGPFAMATAELHEAVRTSGRAVTDEFGRMTSGPEIAEEFLKAWKKREAVMLAMVAYADSLRAIVASAQQAGDAGKQLAEKAGDLATAAGIISPAAGPPLKGAAEMAGRVWKEIALAKSASSLTKALEAVQPAVETIADTIAADTQDLRRAVMAALENQLGQIKNEPGYNDIVGFHLKAPAAKAAVLKEDLEYLSSDGKGRLDAIDRKVASTREDYQRFQALNEAVRERSRRISALVDATGDAVARWGCAHKSLVQAMQAREPVTVDSLLDAVADVRQLIKKVRDL